MAIKAIETWDADLAEEIIRRDYEIDEAEVEVEEECLKILALHQPVAVDLRFLIAVIKINSELERIGDEAVNIANRVRKYLKTEKARSVLRFQRHGGESCHHAPLEPGCSGEPGPGSGLQGAHPGR